MRSKSLLCIVHSLSDVAIITTLCHTLIEHSQYFDYVPKSFCGHSGVWRSMAQAFTLFHSFCSHHKLSASVSNSLLSLLCVSMNSLATNFHTVSRNLFTFDDEWEFNPSIAFLNFRLRCGPCTLSELYNHQYATLYPSILFTQVNTVKMFQVMSVVREFLFKPTWEFTSNDTFRPLRNVFSAEMLKTSSAGFVQTASNNYQA